MSFKAMNWAIRQRLPSTQKLVLMMLADRHNSDNGQCNPSHTRLIEDCGLARSTVQDTINKLSDAGYLRIINRAKNNVKVPNQYMLFLSFGVQENTSEVVFYDEPDVESSPSGVARQSGDGSPAIGLPMPGNRATVARQSGDGSPIAGHKPVIEPVIEPLIPNTTPQAAVSSSALAQPDDVDQTVWQDFVTLRKAKKAPLTKTAIDGIRSQAEKASLTLDAALRMCCERGWTGFKADWLKPAQAGKAGGTTGNGPETFRERDSREGRAKWERMTGRIHPDNLPAHAASNVIDVTSAIVCQTPSTQTL